MHTTIFPAGLFLSVAYSVHSERHINVAEITHGRPTTDKMAHSLILIYLPIQGLVETTMDGRTTVCEFRGDIKETG
jgi:hypothetical protein